MPFSTELYILYALIAVIVLLVVWVIHLEITLRKLLCGTGAKSLDEVLAAIKKELAFLQQYKEVSENYIAKMDARVRKSITGIHTTRFNPFKGTGSGGNQSFATALVNENGDGVVLSSLYAREHVSIFSKPINHFASEYELSEEEKGALSQAKSTLNN